MTNMFKSPIDAKQFVRFKLITEIYELEKKGAIQDVDINAKINSMNNQQLQDLIWKVKQAKSEGIDSPFTIATIYWDPDIPGYRIAVPYDGAFVGGLKHNIPEGSRAFDQATKTWTILGESYFKVAQRLMWQFFAEKMGDVKTRREFEYERIAAEAQNKPLSKEELAAFTFVAHLDVDSISAAFKKRVITLHPDKGGNPKDFTDFNSAYQFLVKELKESK